MRHERSRIGQVVVIYNPDQELFCRFSRPLPSVVNKAKAIKVKDIWHKVKVKFKVESKPVMAKANGTASRTRIWPPPQRIELERNSLERTAPPRPLIPQNSYQKIKVKVHTLDIAPLRSESPPQKRSGMARVLKGFYSFTCTPTRSSDLMLNKHTWLDGAE